MIEGDNVDCWMEIQSGKGPWAPPVSGIVPIGSTLTLVVAINDYRGKPFELFEFIIANAFILGKPHRFQNYKMSLIFLQVNLICA